MSTLLELYLVRVKRLGFEVVLEMPFIGDNSVEEKLMVFFKKNEGILLSLDTYRGSWLNGANAYFNWKSHTGGNAFQLFASGSPVNEEGICSVRMDFQESLEYQLDKARKRGTFITPWVDLWSPPFNFLLNYMERNKKRMDSELDKIVDSRLAMLPEYVRKAIGR